MEPEHPLPCARERATRMHMSQLNPIRILTPFFFKVCLCSHRRLGVLTGLFHSGFQTKINHAFFNLSHAPTYSAHTILQI